MHRWARHLVTGAVLAVAATLTLGPLPVRPLSFVTSVVSSITGQDPGGIRPVVEACSNVLMFAALAIALLVSLPRPTWWRVAIALTIASAAVELAQGVLLVDRHAELQDVVLNGVGAWMGSGFVAGVRRSRGGGDPATAAGHPADDLPRT